MNLPVIPLAKQIVRALTLDQAQDVAQEALEMNNPEAMHAPVSERVPAAAVDRP